MKALTLILLLVLSGCAQHSYQSYRLNPDCPGSAVEEVALLNVSDGNTNTQLVLHVQQADKRAIDSTGEIDTDIIVALNPVGVPLFSAQLQQGDISVNTAPGYRGPDAASIIWAYQLWRQRDQAAVCWPSAQHLQVRQTPGDLTLRSGKRILAQWQAQSPAVILLPQEKLRISVRKLD